MNTQTYGVTRLLIGATEKHLRYHLEIASPNPVDAPREQKCPVISGRESLLSNGDTGQSWVSVSPWVRRWEDRA